MAKRAKDVIRRKKTPPRVPRVNGGNGVSKRVGEIEAVSAGNGAKQIGAAEKLLLGMAPTDTVVMLPRELRGLIGGDATTTRLELVQAFLERNPEVRTELEREADEIWTRVGRKQEEFTAAIAERRAQVLSRAQLSNADEAAPAAVNATLKELARYLAEMYGVSA